MEETMRKTLMLIAAATALTILSAAAQNPPTQPNSGTQPAAQPNPSAQPAAQPTPGPQPAAQPNPAAQPAAQPNPAAQSAAQPSPAAESNPAADTPGEKNLSDSVNIVELPKASPSKDSATISWDTNKEAATDVWLEGGDINGHRTGYQKGASKSHSVTFSNLKPSTTYNYKIRSSKGQVRYEGSFTTKG